MPSSKEPVVIVKKQGLIKRNRSKKRNIKVEIKARKSQETLSRHSKDPIYSP